MIKSFVRGSIVLLLVVAFLTVASVVLAAGGDSPANGILVNAGSAETCVAQTLAPGAQIWFKIPYHAGTDLELYAKAFGGVSFAVYDPERITPSIGSPVGLLTPNKNEPTYLASWLGHAGTGVKSDFMYVLATNTTQFTVTFSFCSQERNQFVPPPPPPPVEILCIPPTGILSISAQCIILD
jgi:hypothetical protein